MPPSTPRRICRPTWLPIVRAACLAIDSTMPWRRLVPKHHIVASPAPGPRRPARARPWRPMRARRGPRRQCRACEHFRGGIAVDGGVVLAADRAGGAHRARSASVIAPIRQRGGATSVRSTGIGTPLSSSIDTSASPTPSCEIVFADVEAADWARTFRPRSSPPSGRAGVNARSACWTRLPSWPRIVVRHVVRDTASRSRRRRLSSGSAAPPARCVAAAPAAHRRTAGGPRRRRRRASACRGRRPPAASRTAPTAATAGSSNTAAASGSAGRPPGC